MQYQVVSVKHNASRICATTHTTHLGQGWQGSGNERQGDGNDEIELHLGVANFCFVNVMKTKKC